MYSLPILIHNVSSLGVKIDLCCRWYSVLQMASRASYKIVFMSPVSVDAKQWHLQVGINWSSKASPYYISYVFTGWQIWKLGGLENFSCRAPCGWSLSCCNKTSPSCFRNVSKKDENCSCVCILLHLRWKCQICVPRPNTH